MGGVAGALLLLLKPGPQETVVGHGQGDGHGHAQGLVDFMVDGQGTEFRDTADVVVENLLVGAVAFQRDAGETQDDDAADNEFDVAQNIFHEIPATELAARAANRRAKGIFAVRPKRNRIRCSATKRVTAQGGGEEGFSARRSGARPAQSASPQWKYGWR